MRLAIDYNKCTGLGLCEAEAPDVFEVQADGTLLCLDESPSEELRAEVEAACAACPTEALRIIEG